MLGVLAVRVRVLQAWKGASGTEVDELLHTNQYRVDQAWLSASARAAYWTRTRVYSPLSYALTS